MQIKPIHISILIQRDINAVLYWQIDHSDAIEIRANGMEKRREIRQERGGEEEDKNPTTHIDVYIPLLPVLCQLGVITFANAM